MITESLPPNELEDKFELWDKEPSSHEEIEKTLRCSGDEHHLSDQYLSRLSQSTGEIHTTTFIAINGLSTTCLQVIPSPLLLSVPKILKNRLRLRLLGLSMVEHAGPSDFRPLRRTSAPAIRDAIGTAIGDAPLVRRDVWSNDGWF